MKIIRIKDYYGIYQEVPVDDSLYEEWKDLHRAMDRNRKKEKYHRSEVPYAAVEETYEAYSGDFDEMLVRKEENDRLYAAIAQLTPAQQRRVMMFMDNMTYSEIARAENRAFYAVHKSLNLAFKKLQMLLSE